MLSSAKAGMLEKSINEPKWAIPTPQMIKIDVIINIVADDKQQKTQDKKVFDSCVDKW